MNITRIFIFNYVISVHIKLSKKFKISSKKILLDIYELLKFKLYFRVFIIYLRNPNNCQLFLKKARYDCQ